MSQKQFPSCQREMLERLLEQGRTKPKIASIFGFSVPAIYKEIKRNSNAKGIIRLTELRISLSCDVVKQVKNLKSNLLKL